MFQCQGVAVLRSTSTLRVLSAKFNQTTNAWDIMISFSLGHDIRLHGLAGLFVSKGGTTLDDARFYGRNFPCRVEESRTVEQDLSTSIAETACCLADFRNEYITTQIFREYTDGLDLVAANDVCDAADGSNILVNANLEVIGTAGTIFVDTDGNGFAESIRVDLLGVDEADSDFSIAMITIPDAELYKVSRESALEVPEGEAGPLTDSREMMIGLLDMRPTGTRLVESTSQQISVELTRTQYSSSATFGQQSMDFNFITYLNGRVHRVVDHPEFENPGSMSGPGAIYYAEVTFVFDERLVPAVLEAPVVASTVKVSSQSDPGSDFNACEDLPAGFLPLALQSCGSENVGWGEAPDMVCPQVSVARDHLGRIYIPLQLQNDEEEVNIEFDFSFVDAAGRNASLAVNMALVTTDFVRWCEEAAADVDLASRVIPSLLIGSYAGPVAPPRMFEPADSDFTVWPSGARTLRDGLVTLIVELNEMNGQESSLELVLEDVLVIHVNPGAEDVLSKLKAKSPDYLPTFTYDPVTRDARMEIPQKLLDTCPDEVQTRSFFGCVHKHVLVDTSIADAQAAYLLGSPGPTGAGRFVETMLGSSTAAVTARELGRDYEQYLVAEQGLTVRNPGKVGLWINPGHKWGGIQGNSEYSLSQHLIVYVLFGVRSGASGTVRRMLLEAGSGEPSIGRLAAIKYDVNAASLVERLLPNTIASSWKLTMAVDPREACLPFATLRDITQRRLEEQVAPHASSIRTVQVVSIRTENADCDNADRSEPADELVMVVDVVIALDESSDTFIDWGAVLAGDVGVLSAEPTGGRTKVIDDQIVDSEASRTEPAGGGQTWSRSVVIAVASSAAVALVSMCVVVWKVRQHWQRDQHEEVEPGPYAEISDDSSHGRTSRTWVESMLTIQPQLTAEPQLNWQPKPTEPTGSFLGFGAGPDGELVLEDLLSHRSRSIQHALSRTGSPFGAMATTRSVSSCERNLEPGLNSPVDVVA